MDERVMQFRVGVMVLATLIITAILVVLFGEVPNLVRGSYTIHVAFPQAPGVTKDTPVRKSGVRIGRVTSVELLDQGGVRVTLQIDAGVRLFSNEVCRIKAQLLGDTFLEFYYAGDRSRGPTPPKEPAAQPTGASLSPDEVGGAMLIPVQFGGKPAPSGGGPGKPIGEGAELRGETTPDPLTVIRDMQGDLSRAIGSVARTSDELGEVATRLNGLLNRNEDRINSILMRADQALSVIRSTFENANVLIGDPEVQANFRKAVNDTPQLMADARKAVAEIRTSVTGFDRNMQNLEQFTRPLGENGPALVQRLDHTLENLDTLVGQVSKFGEALNNSQGTLGQLIHNPELYNNLSQTACRLNEITQELRPILNDARVFTDKIARHPESLGVRGALERRPGIK